MYLAITYFVCVFLYCNVCNVLQCKKHYMRKSADRGSSKEIAPLVDIHTPTCYTARAARARILVVYIFKLYLIVIVTHCVSAFTSLHCQIVISL